MSWSSQARVPQTLYHKHKQKWSFTWTGPGAKRWEGVGGLEGTFHLSSVELDNHLLEIVNIYSLGLSHLNPNFNNIILLLRLLTSVYKYS